MPVPSSVDTFEEKEATLSASRTGDAGLTVTADETEPERDGE